MNYFSMEAVAGIIAVFSTISIGMVSFGPIGRALAHRITHGRTPAQARAKGQVGPGGQ